MPVIEPGRATIKTLFALSRNICALPGCEQKLTNPRWPRVKARVAHIRGEKPGSARYDPTMTDKARAHFDNLILLCPTCHSIIDELEPHKYTVEVLEDVKARHEDGYRSKPWATDGELTQVAILLGQQLVASGMFAANPENVGIDSSPPAGVDIRVRGSQAVETSTANPGSPRVRPDAAIAPATVEGNVTLPPVSALGAMTAEVSGQGEGQQKSVEHDLEIDDALHTMTSTHVDLTTDDDQTTYNDQTTYSEAETARGSSPATANGESHSSGGASAP